jgi:hypothetical protein
MNDKAYQFFKDKNYTEAFKWTELSAAQNDAQGQNNIGVMYRDGTGVVQDFVAARKWFMLAAEQGWASSQYNLGYMYYNGQGVKDDVEATKWFKLAAEQGHQSAIKCLQYIEKLKALSEKVNLDEFLATTCNCIQTLNVLKDKLDFSIKSQNCYGELLKKLINENQNAFDYVELKAILTFGLAQKCANWRSFHDEEMKYLHEEEESKIKDQDLCRIVREGIFTQSDSFEDIEITMMDSVQLVTYKRQGYHTKSRIKWLDGCSYKLILIESTHPYERRVEEIEGDRIIRIIDIINNDTVIYQTERKGLYDIGSMTKRKR